MLFPTGSGAVQAEEAGTQATLKVQPILSVALDAAVQLEVTQPILSVALDAAVQLEVTPTEEGSFSASSAKLEVSTNNETGYSLYLATANGESTLKSLNPATTAEVQAVTGEVAATGFGANTWGYNLGQAATEETIYQAVPTTTGEPQVMTTGPTAGDGTVAADVYSLNFGAKVDADLPSGTYGNEVVVSVVTNPEYVLTISGMTNMQDVTAEICAASADGETATLTDTRDNNTYTVAKINGNCWMTQNLRIASGTELTSADSNLPEGTTYTIPTADLTSGNSYTEGRVHAGEPSNGESATDTGYWYNYCAASAGSICSLSSAQNATQSICPAGWELPTGGFNNSQQSSITSYVDAFSPVYSGCYSNGTLSYAGSSGYWWSTTPYGSNLQYYLYYGSGSLSTSYANKGLGLSVRCIRSS